MEKKNKTKRNAGLRARHYMRERQYYRSIYVFRTIVRDMRISTPLPIAPASIGSLSPSGKQAPENDCLDSVQMLSGFVVP